MAGRLRRVPGPVEGDLRRDLRALVTSHPMGETLSAMCLALARAMDDAGEASLLPGLNRQLRENLAELARLAVAAEDDLDAELSAAVRDRPDAGEGEPGGGDREGGGEAG